ncbi:MAG: GAF domain-containing sensor histidine kinase [Gemmatimonadales bacterium]
MSAVRDEARLERLVREFPALVAEHRMEAILQQVADLAAGIIGARYAAIGLLNPDRKTLESFTVSGLTLEQRNAIGTPPLGKGILGLLIREGRPIRLADLSKHPASVGFPEHHPPMQSFLGVPISASQGVIGELYLTEKIGTDEFSAEDEYLAVLLAVVIGSAVENARLHTERSRLLEEVQQLHRSRERFFAMVNHELRNALAAVLGWAEIMVRKKDADKVPRAAYEIIDSAERAAGLISDLLDLSRLDEERLKPVFRQTECTAVLRGAVKRVTPQAEERGIRMEIEAPAEGSLCNTDAHRVEQILVNLLRNAIRHSPRESVVTARLGSADSSVVFELVDQGLGVRPEDAERIFDIYVTTTGEEHASVGLGLPLSRRLARLLGGDLVAVPQEGAGRFVLKLPAARDA